MASSEACFPPERQIRTGRYKPLHEHIRREMGIPENQGKRYSWGYPAIPELEDHFKIFKLLPAAETELGMTLSTSGQLIPEQSTAAIIVHHPQAKYYSVGESRVKIVDVAKDCRDWVASSPKCRQAVGRAVP